MNKTKSIFVYLFFLIAMFFYYVQIRQEKEVSIPVAGVDLYPVDFCFIVLVIFSAIKALQKINSDSVKAKTKTNGALVVLGILFLWIVIKVLIQNSFGTSSIRVFLSMSTGYIFVLCFPLFFDQLWNIRKFMIAGSVFCLSIFFLHIYHFALGGYQLHILSGNFITFIGVVYFFVLLNNRFLGFNRITTFLLLILILLIYLMVGHRSGFIGLFLGATCLFFYDRKLAGRQAIVFILFLIVSTCLMLILSSSFTQKIIDRASTTFDTSQDTYQGRYRNIFLVLAQSSDHKILGRMLGSGREDVKMKKRHGTFVKTTKEAVVVPHNVIMEFIYFYGYPGFLLGVINVSFCFLTISRYMRKHKKDPVKYQIGIAMACAWMHNLFYGCSNVTIMSVYTIFSFYLPILILISADRSDSSLSLRNLKFERNPSAPFQLAVT